MVKICVCDREKTGAARLAGIIERSLKNCEISIYTEPRRALEEMAKKSLWKGLIFMDMEFGPDGGVEMARRLSRGKKNAAVIFSGEKPEDIQRAFDFELIYFLQKPVYSAAVREALQAGKRYLDRPDSAAVAVAERGKIYRVECGQLYYVESSNQFLTFVGKKERRTVRMKLDELVKILPGSFLRCHKSYAVNMNFIEQFGIRDVILENGEKIPVSRGHYAESKKRFENFCLEG